MHPPRRKWRKCSIVSALQRSTWARWLSARCSSFLAGRCRFTTSSSSVESGVADTKGTSMSNTKNVKAGLDALLTPDNSVLILIDHQPFQFAGLRSHDTQSVINNVVGLAKSAKIFGVPTLLTTVVQDRGGYLIKQLQDVFPEQKPIDRTYINTWQDARVVEWVKKTGRKKIVMAALWTEICLAMPAIQAQGEGYEVYAVTDASGGVSVRFRYPCCSS